MAEVDRPDLLEALVPSLDDVPHEALHTVLRIGRNGTICTNGSQKKEQLFGGTWFKRGLI